MADYEVFTRTITERHYQLSVASQFKDLEDLRLTDTMVRKAVNNDAIDIDELSDGYTDTVSKEEIVTIKRDGKTIWEKVRSRTPRTTSKSSPQTTIDEALAEQ
jgi:hypothetical protein